MHLDPTLCLVVRPPLADEFFVFWVEMNKYACTAQRSNKKMWMASKDEPGEQPKEGCAIGGRVGNQKPSLPKKIIAMLEYPVSV